MSYDRRIELIHILLSRTNGEVYQGPFKGMKILPKWSWGDGDVGGKILGVYESELFPAIETAISNNPDLVLNIGCAEGFYGIGLAIRTGRKTILFDLMESAISIARENAQANGVNNILFSNECTAEVYQHYLNQATNPLVVMDCEGAEDQLLDLSVIPALLKTSIIVESHDCNIPGLTNKLIERFKDTHNIEIIEQGAKNPYTEITRDFSDWDKMLLSCEFRPSTMSWLYLTPKT